VRVDIEKELKSGRDKKNRCETREMKIVITHNVKKGETKLEGCCFKWGERERDFMCE